MSWSDPTIVEAAEAIKKDEKAKPPSNPPLAIHVDEAGYARVDQSLHSEKMMVFATEVASHAFHAGAFGPEVDLLSRQMLVAHALGMAIALVSISSGSKERAREMIGEAIVLALQTSDIMGDEGLDYARNYLNKNGGGK